MEISSCVKAVSMAATQYNNNRSNSNMGYLLHQLEMLQTVSARSESLKPLRPNEMVACECLNCLIEIITNASNKPGLVIQCLHIFNNLVKDAELCRMMQESFNMDHVLAGILKTYGGSPEDNLTLVCLQLLQRVTYGHRISFHESFVDELIRYLVKQILSPPCGVTQPCLGVLANLCHDNFPIQARIKSMDNVQRVYKTLCKFFDQDLTTAIFALSVFTSLSVTEDLGDKVFFNSQNIKQVLQLVFNVLVNGEAKVARLYAVDLLQDMLRNPRLQQAVEEHTNLPKCLEDTLKLISSSSGSSVTKIFELLISFCALGSLRSCLCRLLFSCPQPPAEKFNALLGHPPTPDCAPLVATVCWAALPAAASSCKAALAALEFLKEMYEVLLCGEEQELQSGINLVLPVLVQILRTPLSPDTSHMKEACRRLSAALRLCMVLCTEDEFKASVAQTVKTQDFVSLLRFQLSSNKMVQKSASILKHLDHDQDWCEAGVEVVLLAMQLMSKIRRYVQGLEDLFFQLLQDNEVVPFIAKGWSSRDGELVQISLQLTCLGSSLDNFPDVILGDAVAAANTSAASSAAGQVDSMLEVSRTASHHGCVGGENKENMPLKPRGDLSVSTVQVADDSIQSLIEKMHSAIELKDLKTADIIEIYEHRLQSHQTKEDHLQDLLEAKSLALAQADRLIAQYRARQARHGAEAHKMRCLFQEAERKNEGLLQEMNDLKLDKDRLKNDYDILKHEKNQLELKALELEELKSTHGDLIEKSEELESSLTKLQQELKTTSEMHEMLQKHYEALKHQHDVASEQLKKLEDERKQLSRTLKEKESKLLETTKSLQALSDKHSRVVKDQEELEQEKDTLEKAMDKLRASISATEHTNRELAQKVKSLERLTLEQEDSLKSYQDKVTHLESEVSKHAQIASLIHSLSSGNKVNSDILPK